MTFSMVYRNEAAPLNNVPDSLRDKAFNGSVLFDDTGVGTSQLAKSPSCLRSVRSAFLVECGISDLNR
jgi:hypothetical protein